MVGSVVLMLAPDDGYISEFQNMTRLMEQLGVDVPHLFGASGRVLAMEDLGDRTLQSKVRSMTDDEINNEYRSIIDSLLEFQARASSIDNRENKCFEQKFDHEKLMWEVEFANEHYMRNHLGHKPSSGEMERIRDEWSNVCATLAKITKTLAHRDFHSRNIMVYGDRRVWIDYQDARMGRRQYDLASLLLDPYANISPDLEASLVDYYYEGLQTINKHTISYERFINIYKLSGAQRLYKALGTFGYQSTALGVDVYKEHIPVAVAALRRVMNSTPDLIGLSSTLDTYLE